MKVDDSQLMSESFFRASGLAADFAAHSRLGIYIHVPFCPHICPYCDFVKTSRFSRADVTAYFTRLEKQFDQLNARLPSDVSAATVYIGGGTPSLFPASFFEPLLAKIRARFTVEEFTVESNPFSNTRRVFSEWKELGANRITLGAQSLDSGVLKYLGRKHSAESVLKNVAAARDAGLAQVQVDLIFGIKDLATQRTIVDEIQTLEASGATGVSCYLLTIEDSTSFAHERTADDDVIVAEYEDILATCQAVGFFQHETSNFSKYMPVHNRLYWYGLPYVGLGTGAHGLLPGSDAHPLGRRYTVGPSNLHRTAGDDELLFESTADELFRLEFVAEQRSRDAYAQELLMTLARTSKGIPLAWLESIYSAQELARLWTDPRIDRALDAGSLRRSATHLQLSAREKLRGDSWSLLLCSLLHP